MKTQIWSLIFVLLLGLQPPALAEEPYSMVRMYEKMRDMIFNIYGGTSTGTKLARAARLNKIQTPLQPDTPFPCDTSYARSPTRPETVHQLRPGDIDVVGAMGDSLTAANGAAATNYLDVGIENRGLSWAIGGQGNWRQYLTLPNILKEFNPNLLGYSLGDALSFNEAAQFNVAELGSMSQDLYYMARVLVKRIRSDRRVDVEKDWKLITIMIGPNNFCADVCYLSPEQFKASPETHRKELTSTLEYLRDNLPRTLINLVLAPSLEVLHDLKGLPDYCVDLLLFSCPCLFGKVRQDTYAANVALQKEWQRVEREVVGDERFQRKPDFGVVLQPFTRRITFPEVRTQRGTISDRSFLSYDCFHFSQKGMARAANALWNNLMEPVGNKSENWSETFSRFLCPTKEHPYIYTNGNSFPEVNY